MFKFSKVLLIFILLPISVSAEKIAIEPVELAFSMNQSRQTVFDYFNKKYGAKMSSNFWQTSFNNEIPHNRLKNIGFESIKQWRSIQLLALEYGITDDVLSFVQLTQKRKKINQQRLLDKSNKKVVFGPVEYSERTFHRLYMNNLIYALRQKLSQLPKSIKDAEIKAYYQDNRENFSQGHSVKYLKWTLDKNCLMSCQDLIKQQLSNANVSFDQIVGLLHYTTLLMTEKQIPINDNERKIFEIVSQLADGQVSATLELSDDSLIIVKRSQVVHSNYYSLAQANDEIHTILIEKLVHRMIENKVDDLLVKDVEAEDHLTKS
ncbi:MAG: hypothetical protein HRT38_13105 [Alteromonadaceae bacterium]|nr:hypothetical protein [Alteromonadaceae bacterium]